MTTFSPTMNPVDKVAWTRQALYDRIFDMIGWHPIEEIAATAGRTLHIDWVELNPSRLVMYFTGLVFKATTSGRGTIEREKVRSPLYNITECDDVDLRFLVQTALTNRWVCKENGESLNPKYFGDRWVTEGVIS